MLVRICENAIESINLIRFNKFTSLTRPLMVTGVPLDSLFAVSIEHSFVIGVVYATEA